jgi:UDP-glucose 4-epimerase
VRVLVTGGAGFIGSHVVEQLLAGGHDVAALDDLSTGKRENLPPGVPLFVTDLRDRAETARVLAEFRPEAVSHQAAQASVSVSMRESALDAAVNVLGSIHLFDACAVAGVKRVVFASTGGAIYGEVPPGTKATERTIPAPESPYAIHKLAAEQHLAVYRKHRGLETCILRYANVYGPRQDPHGEAGVVAIFLASALEGQPLRVHAMREAGDGGCVRDYVYVSDVARMNVLALTGAVTELVANVGTGIPTTTADLARAVLGVTACDVPVHAAAPRAGDLCVSLLDPTVPEKYLRKLVRIEEGLASTRASLG